MVVVVDAGSHAARSIVIGALPSAWPAEFGGGRGISTISSRQSLVCSICSSEHLNFQMVFKRATTDRLNRLRIYYTKVKSRKVL